jgi:hypothetical protein
MDGNFFSKTKIPQRFLLLHIKKGLLKPSSVNLYQIVAIIAFRRILATIFAQQITSVNASV